ncbi:MAG: hemerythrin domain-containing protein, partial [Terrabacter sp.]|nr:hemerythrin domain-containing protein [Terrabacter sp.]
MAQMSMNKVIHAAFRRDLQRFLDALTGVTDGDTARAAQLGKAWDNFDAQLTDHHEGEHEIAWPAMRSIGVTDELLAVFDAEHDRMAEALAATRRSMATFRASATAAD